jgi:hypothetical protein
MNSVCKTIPYLSNQLQVGLFASSDEPKAKRRFHPVGERPQRSMAIYANEPFRFAMVDHEGAQQFRHDGIHPRRADDGCGSIGLTIKLVKKILKLPLRAFRY